MTIITLLIILEVVLAIATIIWLVFRAHKKIKYSPAEEALRTHLQILEAQKEAQNSKPVSIQSLDTGQSQKTSTNKTVKNNTQINKRAEAIAVESSKSVDGQVIENEDKA